MSRDTENFSIYSLISIRTIFVSSSNRLSASALASSVLPTPVGPRNIKEPIGFVSSLMPALERIIASVTLLIPSSCPITLLWSSLSRFNVFCRSLSVSFATGIPVHRDTIRPISSSVTCSRTRESSEPWIFCSCSSSWRLSSGSFPYWSSAARFRSYSLWAFSISLLTLSICSLKIRTWSTSFLSDSHFALAIWKSSRSWAISFWIASRRSLLRWSSSRFKAASSISSCIIFLETSSSSAGMESSSVLIRAQASSPRSMALSGRKRSEI